MAFPVTGTLDTFNRGDGALGANWTGAFFGDSSDLAIISSAASSASTNFGGSSWNTSVGQNFEVWGILAANVDSSPTDEVWLEGTNSQTSGTASGYGLVAASPSGANAELCLYRFNAGTNTKLQTNTGITWAIGDGFGFSRVGNVITTYRQPSGGAWAQVNTYTDASPPSMSGAVYLGCECSSNGTGTRLDSFGGGSLGAIVYAKTGAGFGRLYATGRRGGTQRKTGVGAARLYATGIHAGTQPKKGAGVAKAYASGGKQYITPSNFLTTTMPVVPFREQFTPGVYNKTGRGIGSLSATGAKQYLLGGTGVLYQKTGAAAAKLYSSGDSQRFYGKTGAGTGRLYGKGARAGGTIPPPPIPPLYIFRDAVLTVAGVDLSDHVDSLEILIHQDMIDITRYGDTAPHYTLGLRTDRISVTFLADFGANKTHQVISGLLGSAGFTVTCKPRTGVTAVSNPLYTATCILASYTPLGAKVGDRSDAPVVFQPITAITQATS